MAEKEYQELNKKLDEVKQLIVSSTKEVLSIDECALFTGFTVSHLYRMTSQRTIPFYKPLGGKIFFKRTEIENWLLQGRQATNAEISSQATTYCATHK